MAMLSEHLDTIKSALEDKRRIVGDTPEIDSALTYLDSLGTQSASLEAILRDVVEWQHVQFPQRTSASIATHLLEEAQELHREPTNEMEMADVLLLLAGLAAWNGVDLADVAQRKLAINKARTWGKPNEHGVIKHVAAGVPQQPGNPLGDYRDFRGILPSHDPAAPTSAERLRRLREEYEQDAPQD